MDGDKAGGFTRIAVIMAGGSGERFWPLSRIRRPKQLLRLADPHRSLLEQSLDRVAGLPEVEETYIATTRILRPAVEEAGLVPADHVLAEPLRRNTLGCIAWVAANLLARHPDDWRRLSLAFLTADHQIMDVGKFQETVAAATKVAEQTQGLVTIGIEPTRPETGYGYIQFGEPLSTGRGNAVAAFREKPYHDLAEEYFASGQYLWNSGMFFWTLEGFLEELREVTPGLYSTVVAIGSCLASGDEAGAEAQFTRLPSIAVDYALLEKSANVYVVRGDFGWDDLGSFDALQRTLPSDACGNVLHGSAEVLRASGTVVYNENPDLVACVMGVHGLVVIVTEDAVLVCPQHEAQNVREMVTQLGQRHSKHL